MINRTESSYEVSLQSEAFRTIFQNVPWGIVVADQQGRLLFCNPAAEKILGVGLLEPPPDTCSSLAGWFLPDRRTLLSSDQLPMARAIRGEELTDEVFFVRTSSRESGVWIRVDAWPLTGSDEALSGGVLMLHDFTQGREALQTLHLLSRVVEQTADNVILANTQGVIEYVNPAFESTTGYRKDEALGKTPRILKSGLHDAEFYRQMWAKLADGLPFKGMIINRKKTGELYWVQQTISSMRDESGHLTHFISVSQDITELKKKQEQEFQLQLARGVQQRFYAAPPAVPGYDIGASAHPADETGGDYFDFIPMADGSLLIAVADAKGHGFSSALVMTLTRAYVRCFAAMQLELDQILARVNHMLLKDLEAGDFVTLSLARLHPADQMLSYASAGHQLGFVLLESGKLKRALDSTGFPLGLFPESTYTLEKSIRLESGEIALFLTDGVTEATTPNGQQFGTQGLLDYVRDHRQHSASEISNGIFEATRLFAQGDLQDDDITSVIVKAHGTE